MARLKPLVGQKSKVGMSTYRKGSVRKNLGESAFGVEHGEFSKGLFSSAGSAGKHAAGARKLGFSLKNLGVRSTGGARKAGAHAAGRRSNEQGSFSFGQTGGSHRYQGRHVK